MPTEKMKKEYDFSKGTRGKFYRPGIRLRLPIYLDDEAMAFVQQVARKRRKEVSDVVNDLILSDKRLSQALG